MTRVDQYALQLISAGVIVVAASNQTLVGLLTGLFPYSQVVIPTAAFLVLYQALALMYSFFLWPLVHRRAFLGGTWIYSLHNHITNKKLYGVFTIDHGMNGICVREGRVWFCGAAPEVGNQRGVWTSLASDLREEHLFIIFEMQTTVSKDDAGEGLKVEGTMALSLIRESGAVSSMSGRYFDHNERSGMQGSVAAQRVKAKTTRELERRSFKVFGNAA